MERTAKLTKKHNAKRNLFAELREGMNALSDARLGKRRLRTHSVEYKSTLSPSHRKN